MFYETLPWYTSCASMKEREPPGCSCTKKCQWHLSVHILDDLKYSHLLGENSKYFHKDNSKESISCTTGYFLMRFILVSRELSGDSDN